MTYSIGGLIEATDYNTFVGNTTAGLNQVWGGGSGDAGWGQTSISTVSSAGTVSATNWASLVNTLSSAGSQTAVAITSRTAPVTGNTIGILANVAIDIANVTTNRGSAAASGTEYGTFTGTTSKTTGTGSGQASWTITFTHTVTFPSANQARYFFNAGGRVRLQYGKSSNTTDIDPEWNTFAGKVGSIYLAGYVNSRTNTIAGVSYTGTTRIGGTGGTQTTLATSTGWYQLTGTPATILLLYNNQYLYTGEYIQTTATATSSTVLTLVTTWFQPAVTTLGSSTPISGGTAVSSPATSIGAATAPTTLCTYLPPSTTYLTNSWGTPTIAASVA